MTEHGWWSHLFNDPMRDNPWSLAGLAVIVIATIGVLWLLTWLRDRWWPRRKRGKRGTQTEP